MCVVWKAAVNDPLTSPLDVPDELVASVPIIRYGVTGAVGGDGIHVFPKVVCRC